MSERDSSSFNKMFDARWFVNSARAAMLAASLIGVPMAMMWLQRIVNKSDTVIEKLDKTAGKVELLEQSVHLNFEEHRRELDAIGTRLNDHEQRIRVLERQDAAALAAKAVTK